MSYLDMYDLAKVIKAMVKLFPEEIIMADCNKNDFREIQEKHVFAWKRNAYQQKEPVRFISLQASNWVDLLAKHFLSYDDNAHKF